jgi:hypothetical protein
MIKVAEVASFIDGHPPPALTPWAPVMKAVNRGTDTARALRPTAAAGIGDACRSSTAPQT